MGQSLSPPRTRRAARFTPPRSGSTGAPLRSTSASAAWSAAPSATTWSTHSRTRELVPECQRQQRDRNADTNYMFPVCMCG